MLVSAFRFITILLAALALTMESAHVLELPQKMQYDAHMYAAVNTTLYRYFAIVGGVYQLGSIGAGPSWRSWSVSIDGPFGGRWPGPFPSYWHSASGLWWLRP